MLSEMTERGMSKVMGEGRRLHNGRIDPADCGNEIRWPSEQRFGQGASYLGHFERMREPIVKDLTP
jgi:hypothetical protein